MPKKRAKKAPKLTIGYIMDIALVLGLSAGLVLAGIYYHFSAQ